MNDCFLFGFAVHASWVPVLKPISRCHYHIGRVSWFQGLFDSFVSFTDPKERERSDDRKYVCGSQARFDSVMTQTVRFISVVFGVYHSANGTSYQRQHHCNQSVVQ